MKQQFKPGQTVLVDAGLGVMKQGSIQRLAESVAYVKHFNGAIVGYKYDCIKPATLVEEKQSEYGVGLASEFDMIRQIMEKKLTPAELKKREEVAQAIERENPGMDMGKKMAIATATAKKVAEELKGGQKKLDKNHNGKLDSDDFKILRGEKKVEEGVMDTVKKVAKKVGDVLGHGDDDQMRKDLQKKMGIPQTGKPSMAKQNEEAQVNEAMISYSDFQSKIDAHKKAGNKIKDDKYDKNKASYTVVDQDGVGKKITHTASGIKQDHLGQVEKVKDAEETTTEKRGRGRPAGSKSGARN